jgi:tetrahydromethanopterin S-methyltransferase subunit E
MWNRGEIDYKAEREGQEFQAKSGVARVVAPYSSSVKFSKAAYHLTDCDDSNFASNNFVSNSSFRRIAEESASQIIPVVFAVFINLLDACTFGTVFFPAKFGGNVSGLAIELFLFSTLIV